MKNTLFATAACLLATSALANQPVSINFSAEIDGKPFACGQTYEGLGAAGTAVTVTDYRMFVSDASLVKADGGLQPIALEQDGQWQLETLALLDFEDGKHGCAGSGNAAMNTTLRGTVPAGEYVGLSFTLGVPFGQNHIDPTLSPAPLNTTGMFWNWQNGFRFVRIDMVPVAADAHAMDHAHTEADSGNHGHSEDGHSDNGHSGHAQGDDERASGWFLHLGSTQCAAESRTEAPSQCANPNHVTVTFTDFDPASNIVVIDPAKVVAEADLTLNTADTSPGCMAFPGDADCNTVMTKLGLPYDGIAADAQQLLSVR